MQVKDSSHDWKTEGKYRVAYVDTVMCFSVQMVFHEKQQKIVNQNY